MSSAIDQIDGLTIQRSLTTEEKLEASGPYAALIRDAIDTAIDEGASDVHFESTDAGITIRLRIGGVLEDFYCTSKSTLESMTSVTLRKSFFMEVKRIANLSLGKFGVAQDSRVSFERRGVEARVNLIPTIYGEKVVLRLFYKSRKFDLTGTGYTQSALEDIRSVIGKNSGLIILSGETGSGKTTSLYSIMSELDRKSLNIATLEDPVEHIFPGINHTPVTSRFSFADGLRALLRQDPDVILIGEIRDSETAKLANRAAQTGHLVFSTVHTNAALSIPSVFEFYGVEPSEVAPNILLGGNQRLLRKICPKCSIAGVDSKLRRAHPEGCSQCKKGYLRERQVVFEYFLNNGNSNLKLKRSMDEEVLYYASAGIVDEREIYENSRSFIDSHNAEPHKG